MSNYNQFRHAVSVMRTAQRAHERARIASTFQVREETRAIKDEAESEVDALLAEYDRKRALQEAGNG